MTNVMTKAGLGVALAATVLTTAAPAEAQRWRGGGRYDRGDVAGAALVGGIVGLGVGAAIASNRGGYYNGYYGPYYGPRYNYYAPPVVYRPRVYRPRAFYAPRYAYRGYAARRPIVRYRGVRRW
jgi:hypothetical protein